MQDFWVYLLLCSDDSFYVGHTDNIETRLAQHQSGATGGYTFRRRPVTLIWSDRFPTRDQAKAVEAQIKGWSRAKKIALADGDWAKISQLASSRTGRKDPWQSPPDSQEGQSKNR